MTTVSVVIPVRNGAVFLSEAIESAIDQSRPPDEIVVVDDGSTDESAQVAASFDGVRVLRRPPEGVAAARNAGVAASGAEIIAFLDADDLWVADKLEVQVDQFSRRPELDCSFGREELFLAPGASPPPWVVENGGLSAAGGRALASTLVIRRRAWQRVGPMNAGLAHAEDTDWLLRGLELGLRVEALDRILVRRRLHGANATYDEVQMRRGLALALKGRIDRRRAPDPA